ncbi:MAG TPA: hypothetical protein VJM11_13915 [Nevskiaceae bacterium]|nr:hypothetical protein [Nevskiaceae bacterium]
MRLRFAAAAVALAATATGAPAAAPPLKLKMELGLQGRAFAHDGAWPEQRNSGVAVSVQPEIDWGIPHGNVRFVPFARWDQKDDERTHADIRELTVRQRHGNWDVVAGIGRVFWGTTESVHLVDIINQTDGVEDPDGEDKLGQPMVNVAWTTRAGVWSAFLLPYHRDRTLPGEHGRFRGPVPFDRGDPIYESSHEEERVDVAGRWSLSKGPLDVGLSAFHGNAREPRYEPTVDADGIVLTPVYDVIEQYGLDGSVVRGGWLYKLEAIHNVSRVEDFTATAAGFEYTYSSVKGSSWDVGALAEFLWDSRGGNAPSAFQKDVFVGSRLSANDVAGTEILAGVVADLERESLFGNVEASRRVGVSGKIAIELRFFGGGSEADPLAFFRRDDYLQVEYTRYF